MAADNPVWAEPGPTACPNRASCEGKLPADSSFFSPISRLHIDTTTFIGGTPNQDAATAGGGHRQSAHPNETTFTFDLRLTLDSSFTGKDLLRTRLRAGNTVAYRFGSEAALIRDPNFSPRAVGRGQQSNSVALAAYWQPIENSGQPSISLGNGVNTTSNGSMPESQSWMLGLQWDQQLSTGHTAGIAIGQAPFTRHRDTQSWLVDTFYRAQISDSISVTTALFDASSYRENQFNPTWGGLIKTNLRF